MDNNYLPEKVYKVYQIMEVKAKMAEPVYGLFDTENKFKTYELAYEWIETEGTRQKIYSIIEEFRKP